MLQELSRAAVLLGVAVLTACVASSPNQTPIASEQVRLNYAFTRPAGGSERHLRVDAPDRTFSEERYDWQNNTDALNRGGLVLRELKPGATGFGFAVPTDPKKSVDRWSTLADKTLFFDDPFITKNRHGTATWRRFTRASSVCVVFLQTWPPADEGPVTRTLEGYYCAEAGGRMSVGQAEQVVQSVHFVPPKPEPGVGS